MFFDEVSAQFEGGRGGNGFVSFRREKFVPKGAPDGGDGGDGGNIILIADANFNTLGHFLGRKHFKAEKGTDGHKKNMVGAKGKDLELKVPIGTEVYDEETNELIGDLKKNHERLLIAEGGKGGFGNAHFVTSVRQAPKFAEIGDKGEIRRVKLELKMVADVGLVGLPSAGKSTLISHVSAAKPKIADYPFTTLVPNLGVVKLDKFGGSEDQTFVIADIPGLIEGASEGKGLGHKFLKHVSRTAILVFVLDPFSYDGKIIEDQFSILNKEIKKYSKDLQEKDHFVVINKIDAIPDEDRQEFIKSFLKKNPKEKSKLRLISGVSGENLDSFMKELWNLIEKNKIIDVEGAEEENIYVPLKLIDDHSFKVEEMYEVGLNDFTPKICGQLISKDAKEKRKLFNVDGKRIQQISRMTNVDQEDAVRRVYNVIKKMGISDELKRQGAINGDLFKIEEHIFEYHDI